MKTPQSVTFEEWLRECERVAMRSEWIIDPDWKWRELYDSGLTAESAVDELFKEVRAMWP